MALKWSWRGSHFGEERGTARLGNLILSVIDSDGENQSYSIELEAKAKNIIGKMSTGIFACDTFYGGKRAAKERVEYLARCLYYGLPVKLNAWEKKQNATIKMHAGVRQATPTTKIRDIYIRGIYHLPDQEVYLRADFVSNIDPLKGLKGVIPMGVPSVVLKDILTDRIYTLPIAEFLAKGFVIYDHVDDSVPEVIR